MWNEHGNDNKPRIFKLMLAGAAFLFFAQLSMQLFSFFFLSDYESGLINARFLLWQGIQTWPVIRAILFYVLVYFALLSLLSAIAFLASRFLVIRLKFRESIGKVTFLVLLLLYASLMVTNAFWYPKTLVKLSMVSDWQGANNYIPHYVAVAVLLIVLMASLLEVLFISIQKWQMLSGLSQRLAIVFSLVPISILSLQLNQPDFAFARYSEKQSHQQPNIILIGLDSVRIDVIEDEHLRQQFMPNLDAYLRDENTAWFTNAFTPIARTFAAWYALMSGNEPKTSGVRYNLQPLSTKQKESTIVPLLAGQGYYTIYGSDEKRFSTIDESYSFHETLGPPPGAADWILSFLEDTPIHNILRRTAIARVLLPYTSANRASIAVYRPENFVDEVENMLSAYDYKQPLFLSLHLCLSHWPYTWATGGTGHTQSTVLDYFNSLEALDAQFGSIMAALKATGALENSVQVVFTDHGEGLISENTERDDPRYSHFKKLLPATDDLKIGHGTDLLTINQNKILLSLRDYSGKSSILSGRYDNLSSLLDIAPTLARIGGIQNYLADGFDLSVVANEAPEHRLVFMETGFDLAALHRSDLDVNLIVEQGASAYEISENGLMQVKREYHDHIINNKQKGVTDGQYIVANDIRSPTYDKNHLEFVAIDIANPNNEPSTDKVWSEELNQLKDRLLGYYHDELKNISTE
ncbi:sulfatase-like hydrolase/transferase [Pseudomonadota bacterium]